MTGKTKKRLALAEGWLSIIGNIVLFGLKLWAGLVTGSVALMADAWHTLSDSISSAIVVFSAWVSGRPADDEHHFGHGRSDLICSVIIGVLLAFIGFEFILKALEQFRSGEAVAFGRIAVVVTVVSIVVKESMAQFAFWAARRTANPILRADGWHHRTDAFSSMIVLAGILLSSLFWWIDGLLGILVALLIFYASYEILRDSTNRLTGETPDEKMLAEISTILQDLQIKAEPHHFHLHRYGDHVELTFHLTMAPDLTLKQAHDQAHLMETALRRQLEIEATIHMEPQEK